MRHETYVYDDELSGFLPVLARSEAIATRYQSLDSDYATGKEGAIRKLVKIFAPGYFAGSIPGSAKARILPRMTTAAATAASGTSITFKSGTSGIFVASDVLSIIPPSARVNIASASGGWAAGDTITVTLNAQALVYTVVAGDVGGSLTATNLNVANKIIAAINASPFLSKLVSGLPVAGSGTSTDVVLWSKDFTSLYSLTVADTATNGTATASAASFVPNTAVGTISSVNTATDVVTISAASVSVPSGMPLGVATSLPDNLGMISPAVAVDLLYRESQNYGLYVDTDVYLNRLPYIDGQLTALYPQINLV
ncbi:MAG: hypothetical protein ACO32T_05070 [Candidatus Nanopelagicaceae bacterium]